MNNKSVLVVIDSSVKGLEHNFRECKADNIHSTIMEKVNAINLGVTTLVTEDTDIVLVHCKGLELENTMFGIKLARKDGSFDLSNLSQALEVSTEYFVVK